MRESGIAVAFLALLCVAYLVYWFDPWVGFAAGVVVLLMALVLAVATQSTKEPEKRTFSSHIPWDEEEPTDDDSSER
jgi:hypothetical protein